MKNTLLTLLLICSPHTAWCMHALQATRIPICPTHTPSFPLDVALANGDPNQVITYYSNWHGPYSQAEYAACIANSLRQTAQRPQKETGIVIPFLLERLDPDYLDNINCLYYDARINGHKELIHYIRTQLSSKFPSIQSALITAIDEDQGDPIRVSNLLEAGVAPDEESDYFPLHRAAFTGKSVIVDLLLRHNASTTRLDNNKNLPIFAALHGFDPRDSEDITTQRLRIVQRLIQKMPEHARPIGIEANLCKISQKTRVRLMEALNELHTIPVHICMTDDSERNDKASSKQFVDTLVSWTGWGALTCISLATFICSSLAKKAAARAKMKAPTPKPNPQKVKFRVYDQDKRRK